MHFRFRKTASSLAILGILITANGFNAAAYSNENPNGQSDKSFERQADVYTNADLDFIDLDSNAWYYSVVKQLTQDGIVTGLGNKIFAPKKNITVAELCTLLTKITDTDIEIATTEYWAKPIIEYCLSGGYIQNRGEITAKAYGVPITREEAISALVRIWLYDGQRDRATGMIVESDIPDFSSIANEYAADILAAYNNGITHGMDSSGIFKPNKTLSRAEMCQMIWNALYSTSSENYIVDADSEEAGKGKFNALCYSLTDISVKFTGNATDDELIAFAKKFNGKLLKNSVTKYSHRYIYRSNSEQTVDYLRQLMEEMDKEEIVEQTQVVMDLK